MHQKWWGKNDNQASKEHQRGSYDWCIFHIDGEKLRWLADSWGYHSPEAICSQWVIHGQTKHMEVHISIECFRK